MILIIPRNDGVGVSIGGEYHHITMDARQLFEMSQRFQQAGLEMLRQEQLGASFSLSDALRGLEPADTSGSIPSH